MLDVVSLFSGVGGIDLGFHAAGARTRLLCEYDKHAQKILARRFPGVPIHPDVTELTADDIHASGARPHRTVLAAGFPCQDLSVAGARRGMGEGTRSGLYWHVDRLLGEFRPAWVVLENVPGLLSATCPCRGDESCVRAGLAVRCDGELHAVAGGGACVGGCIAVHGGVMGAVLGSLAERGYGFAYRVLDAQHFGVPQRRRRVVIVGRLGDSGAAPARVLLEPEGRAGDSAAGDAAWPGAAGEAGYGVGVAGEPGGVANTLTARDAKGPLPDQSLGTVIVSALTSANGGPDDNMAQANHLVPATFQKVIRSGARDEGGNLPPEVWAERDVAATLNLHDLGSDTRAVEVIVQPLAPTLQAGTNDTGGTRPPGTTVDTAESLVVTTLGDRTHTLTGEGHDASEDGTGRGTPIIAATITAGTSRPGVNPPGRRQEDDHNIVTFDPKAGGDGTSSGAFEAGTGITPTLQGARAHAIGTETTVRRLTPLECERLQGFPDNWTEGQADSHRYRQMGNAVAVPVFAWVARRLAAIHNESEDA